MSKTINSPVERWPGTVTLYDPLSFPQVIKIKETIAEAQEFRVYDFFCGKCKHKVELDEIVKPCPKCEGVIMQRINWEESHSPELYHNALLPAIVECVETWNLEGMDNPPNPIPATPQLDAIRLITWIMDEIINLLAGTETVPNE